MYAYDVICTVMNLYAYEYLYGYECTLMNVRLWIFVRLWVYGYAQKCTVMPQKCTVIPKSVRLCPKVYGYDLYAYDQKVYAYDTDVYGYVFKKVYACERKSVRLCEKKCTVMNLWYNHTVFGNTKPRTSIEVHACK